MAAGLVGLSELRERMSLLPNVKNALICFLFLFPFKSIKVRSQFSCLLISST